MYNLKGFIGITAFSNNRPDNVSALGELSNISNTYSTEKGYYSKADAEQVQLVTFTSKRDGTAIEAPVEFHAHIISVAQWAFDKSVSGLLSDDSETFRRLLISQFENIVANVEVGKMVSHKTNWLPSYIKWTLDSSQEENELRVWFSDDAFRAQYDDYVIRVIPPLTPVDVFQETVTIVGPRLDEFNLPEHDQTVAAETKGHPYTIRVTNDYPWYDREDPDTTRNTSWTVAIWGAAGNNPIIIKEAIAEYILANSAYSRSDWVPVFPDIFTTTEYVIVPQWHRTSVVDKTVRGQLYSPFVPYDEVLPLAQKYMQYPSKPNHLVDNLEIAHVQYKSLALLSCGGVENRDAKYKLSQQFPRYFVVPTSSPDFNRMDSDTTAWVVKLVGAVIHAETMDEYTYLPLEYARIERDGRLWVGFDHNNVLYAVLAYNSMEETKE